MPDDHPLLLAQLAITPAPGSPARSDASGGSASWYRWRGRSTIGVAGMLIEGPEWHWAKPGDLSMENCRVCKHFELPLGTARTWLSSFTTCTGSRMVRDGS